jgi:hypothetical protein
MEKNTSFEALKDERPNFSIVKICDIKRTTVAITKNQSL